MNKKIQSRTKRLRKTRGHIRSLGANRVSVHRTHQHIYAQLIDTEGKVLASASSLDKELKSSLSYGGNCEAAKQVGRLMAQRLKAAKVEKVAFDRSGFKYHGRVKALADAMREAGVEI